MIDWLLPVRASSRDAASDFWFTSAGTKTHAGVSVTEDTAYNYSACFCATRVICETIASLPIFTFERLGNDDRDYANLLAGDLLKTSPNFDMTSLPFREGRLAHQLNWGNGFAEIEFSQRGEVVALWPIHPSRVKASKKQGYAYEVKNNDGSTIDMLAEEILHLTGVLSDDGIWGRGIVMQGRESIGFGLGTERHGAAYFGSGAQPKGVLSVPGAFVRDREQKAEFRREWKEIHDSPESSEIAILPVGSEYTPISMSPEANQFLQTRKFNLSEMARWYRVPVHMLADLESGTHGNIEQQGMEFIIYSLYPWTRRFEEACNAKLLTRAQRARYYFEHSFGTLIKGDITARMNAYRTAISIGVMTINECRRLENLKGIGPAGDESYVPANMMTASKMLETGGQPSAAGPGSDHTGAPDQFGGQHDMLATKLEKSELKQQMKHLEDELPARESWRRECFESARMVLTDALSRLFTKESNAAQRAAKGNGFTQWMPKFYGEHEQLACETLRAACGLLGVVGVAEWANPSNLAAWLKERSIEQLHRAYSSDSPEAFRNRLAAWPTDRARETASEIMGSKS